ncbi:MAG TPA: 30S ribosomal protein S13 [Nitrososphaerales archaeon]|nr:30S ribosomal protein S13 [Nitrososphaerales archaeon]
MSSSGEYRHLVRMSGKDLDGSKKLVVALADLRGVGDNFARSIVARLELDPRVRLGTLSEEQVKEIEKAVQATSASDLPGWYYNRRKDPETGSTGQLIGTDLEIANKNDVQKEKDAQSWKGVRHSLGLKVRGQRTRTTGRKGRTVGVRKAVLQAAAKAAATEKKEE